MQQIFFDYGRTSNTLMEMEVISLSSLIEGPIEGRDVEEYLHSFICEKNESVESFLHNKAITNETEQHGRTSLVIDSSTQDIIGYFTLTIKPFNFTTASGKNRRKLAGDKVATVFQTILIAKLGRSDAYKGIVSGSNILQLALENCNAINRLAALRIVCVEYEEIEYLKWFYPNNGFTELQHNENGLIISYLRL